MQFVVGKLIGKRKKGKEILFFNLSVFGENVNKHLLVRSTRFELIHLFTYLLIHLNRPDLPTPPQFALKNIPQ